MRQRSSDTVVLASSLQGVDVWTTPACAWIEVVRADVHTDDIRYSPSGDGPQELWAVRERVGSLGDERSKFELEGRAVRFSAKQTTPQGQIRNGWTPTSMKLYPFACPSNQRPDSSRYRSVFVCVIFQTLSASLSERSHSPHRDRQNVAVGQQSVRTYFAHISLRWSTKRKYFSTK